MKSNMKIFLVIILLSFLIFCFIYFFVLRNNIKNIEFNNYNISYNADEYELITIIPVKESQYFSDHMYKTGSLLFDSIDKRFSILYSLKDIELPPSNAINDINPIILDEANSRIYSLDKKLFGFSQILCRNNLQKIICNPITSEYNSQYYYGDELKNGDYVFVEWLNILGMEKSILSITINSNGFPTEGELINILEIQKNILSADSKV